MIGEVIGNFRVTAKLGAGGMGEVFLAQQKNIDTKVAVKVLRPEISVDTAHVERFFNEARAVSRIKHAGIVKIFDVGFHTTGHAYLIMEFLEGETLSSRIHRLGKLALASICDLGRQTAGILEATHAAGITHRDLKPDNIFIVPDAELASRERVKILDFGIAKLTGTMNVNSPRTVGTMGTPAYMAPEQWGDSGKVDWRADIYSLGCVAFEMSAGRTPFPATNFAEACAGHLTQTPPKLRTIVPALPEQLEALLDAMLAKSPYHRPPLRDVAKTFEQLGAGLAEVFAETLPPRPPRSKPSLHATMPDGSTVMPMTPSTSRERPGTPTPIAPSALSPGASSSMPNAGSSTPGASPPMPNVSSSAPGASTSMPNASSSAPGTSSPMPNASSSAPGASTSMPNASSSASGVSSPRASSSPGTSSPGVQPGSTTLSSAAGVAESQPKKSRAALYAIGGLVVVGGGIAAVVAATSGSSRVTAPDAGTPPTVDAALVVQVDAAEAPSKRYTWMKPELVDIGGVQVMSRQATRTQYADYLSALEGNGGDVTKARPLDDWNDIAGRVGDPRADAPVAWVTFEQARRFCRDIGGDLLTSKQWIQASKGSWRIGTPRPGETVFRDWTSTVADGLAEVRGGHTGMASDADRMRAARTALSKSIDAGPIQSIADKAIGIRCAHPQATARKSDAPKPRPAAPKNTASPTSEGEGAVIITSNRQAEIWIDGRSTGQWTPATFMLRAGNHKVRLRTSDDDRSYTLLVKADESTSFHRDLK